MDLAVPANLRCGQPAGDIELPPDPSWARLHFSIAGLWEIAPHDLGEIAHRVQLLDVREPEEFEQGLGHIPGARSAPFTANLSSGPAPVFRPVEELREHYARLGADHGEPIVYCGSGVTACHDLLALHLAGLRGTLYAGSWSEWSSDPELPAATGPD